MTQSPNLFGLIEAGGTKIVCAIATSPENIMERVEIPTRTGEETLRDIIEYFHQAEQKHQALRSIGLGTFGPVNVDPTSPAYGEIGNTVKPGWRQLNVRNILANALSITVNHDTDVNAAMLGEAKHGAGKGLQNLVYITVGTGIGAGVMVDGRVLTGKAHTEIGHMSAPIQADDLEFAGVCTFHQNRCYEGVASGPAIKARWGCAGDQLESDSPAWGLQARYLAALCLDLTLSTVPDRIILGGGVMKQQHLYPMIRHEFDRLNNGYLEISTAKNSLNDYIVPPECGSNAGILGALELARSSQYASLG